MANAFNQDTVSYFRIGGAASLGLLIGLFLVSVPAAAEVYPVSGVWTAIDTDFPAAAIETCVAVKTFGVEAVSKKSISEMNIFAKDILALRIGHEPAHVHVIEHALAQRADGLLAHWGLLS